MLSATSDSKNARARLVEDQGAGDLHLTDVELPPVAGESVLDVEGGGDHQDPAVEEPLDLGGTELVADDLEPGGVLAGGEAVSELGVGQPFVLGAALGPLVPVRPDLEGIGEVRGDLDEAGPEVGIDDVEVKNRHAAVGLREAEVGHPLLVRAVVAHEHPLDLLGRDDRHHPGALGLLEIGPHVIELAVVPTTAVGLLQLQDGDPEGVGEVLDRLAEAVSPLLEEGRRGDGIAEVPGQVGHHLPADLQL